MIAKKEQPLWFRCAKFTIVAVWVLWVSGCTTTAHHADGTPWFKTTMDSDTFYAKSGTDEFYITGMNHSKHTQRALLGTDRIVKTVSGAVVAGIVPGEGATAVVQRVGISTAPHLFSDPKPDVLTK